MKYIVLLLMLLCMAVFNSDAYADTLFYGNAGTDFLGSYTISLEKMEISEDGNNWVTVGEGNWAVNLASEELNSFLSRYLNEPSIPPGTYTKVRFTTGRNLTIKGQGSYNGITYYTTKQEVTMGEETFYKAISDAECYGGDCTTSGQYENVPFFVPKYANSFGPREMLEIIDVDSLRLTLNLLTPLFIEVGKEVAMNIVFDASRMIGFEAIPSPEEGYFFFALPPTLKTE